MEREERLQYLRTQFRLTFRSGEDLIMANQVAEDEDEDYDCVTAASFDEINHPDDAVDMEQWRADFRAINAEDEFIELCLEFYQGMLVETQANRGLREWKTITYEMLGQELPKTQKRYRTFLKNGVWVKDPRGRIKKRNYYLKRSKAAAEHSNAVDQITDKIQAKIAQLKQELAQIKATRQVKPIKQNLQKTLDNGFSL
ncbi:MAG: hypothetical protein NC133_03640 [Prevotella sp.]|nr:hypothetical protein [Prevotella sp.]